jgi:hypothetical protein
MATTVKRVRYAKVTRLALSGISLAIDRAEHSLLEFA